MQHPMIFLVGPTAIGKTDTALALAERYGMEIIGVDSMQIYRHMDIGTAKPSVAERARLPHHLIDYVLPDEEFSVSRFTQDCQTAIQKILANGRLPLLAGGTGLYFNALQHGIFAMPDIDPLIRQGLLAEIQGHGRETLWQELLTCDPESAARLHPNDTYRLVRALEIFRATGKPWSLFIDEHKRQQKGATPNLLKIGLVREREELYRRIQQRVDWMINAGLLTEVETLLQMGYNEKLSPMQSLGYRHMLGYLNGEWGWERAVELLSRDTRRYAKRQLTWFNAEPEIRWFHPDQRDEIAAMIEAFLEHVPT